MELLWDQMGEGTEFTVEERTPEVLRLRVTRCMIADEMRQLGRRTLEGPSIAPTITGSARG